MPVGKVTKGLETLRNIYGEYSRDLQTRPILGLLNTSKVERPPGRPDAATYWSQFPKLDRFRSCRVVKDHARSSDPNSGAHDEL